MQHEKEAKQWIEIANKDLALAEHVVKTMRPIPHELVCFHCQQFVEKYLKAFLVSKGQEPPYIHDLAKLIAICEKETPAFAEIKEKCIILTGYGVQSRYPGNMEIIEEDMIRAMHLATEIKAFMLDIAPKLFQN